MGRGHGACGHLKSSLKRPLKWAQQKGCVGKERGGGVAHTHIMRLNKRGKQAKTTRESAVCLFVCLCVAAVSTQLPLFLSPSLPLPPHSAAVTGQPGKARHINY